MHLCFFSPVWMSKCCLRCAAWLNDFLHCVHLWPLSPLWILRWVFKEPFVLNNLLHCWQLCLSFPPRFILWSRILGDKLLKLSLAKFQPFDLSVWSVGTNWLLLKFDLSMNARFLFTFTFQTKTKSQTVHTHLAITKHELEQCGRNLSHCHQKHSNNQEY